MNKLPLWLKLVYSAWFVVWVIALWDLLIANSSDYGYGADTATNQGVDQWRVKD